MVDGIGKGGPKPPTPGAGGPTKVDKTGRAFEVSKPEGASPATGAQATTTVGSPALEQLKGGQITLDGYLDAKVSEATGHLRGLTPEQLDSVRSMLRRELASDPTLRDLVQQATGHAPALDE